MGSLLALILHLCSDYGFSVDFEIRRFDLSCSDLCVRGMDTDGAFPLSGSLNFTNTAEAEKLLYDHSLPLCETARQLETINRQ